MGKLLPDTSPEVPAVNALSWNCLMTFRTSSMTLSTGRLLATMWRAVPRSSTTTTALRAMPSSTSKTPNFLAILPDLSASKGILQLSDMPPSALEAFTKALWQIGPLLDIKNAKLLGDLDVE